ncbi:putative receptor-like protein kinase At3g47110 [Camellia sinensis]|uniref:putative receptor-like protein kinase At3g47110 n=1 Tax=Camellia sinensis TaxID=4442 RepID=UPI001035DC7B|nr:putative receptor-like protein kinase At3g47110 [Camellia sinensis]
MWNVPWGTVFILALWKIWKDRNNMVFCQEDCNAQKAVRFIHLQAIEIQEAFLTDHFTGRKIPQVSNWCCPLAGKIKLNTDGCSKGNPGPAGYGGLFRDERGTWLHGYHGKLENATSEVPSGLYNISTIIALSVCINQLEGNIPPDIGSPLPNLKFLYLFVNLFTGTLPTSLSNASELESIDFSQNDFNGRMPRDLGKLHGSLPDSVANLSTYLSYFNLEINQIHGSILSGIGKLLKLTLLSMVANNLAGPIPSSIGTLHKLQELLLGGNKFTKLSSSLGNLTFLIILDLSENNIHGSITPSLGNCHSLLQLALSQKNLNGSIPPEIMSLSSISTFLLLNHNALIGSLPSEVGSLTNLGHMDVSYNRLSGPIPNTLSNCLNLEWLQLEANSFEGEIPKSLRKLRGLRVLDL